MSCEFMTLAQTLSTVLRVLFQDGFVAYPKVFVARV